MERTFQIEGHTCKIVVTTDAQNAPSNQDITDRILGAPISMNYSTVEATFDELPVYKISVYSDDELNQAISVALTITMLRALKIENSIESTAPLQNMKNLGFS